MAKLRSRIKMRSGQVKASTLLEVIVAMVIILVIFSLAIGIYNNVLSATIPAKKQQVNALTEHMIRTSINEKNWNDEETMQDSITLKKIVLPYEKYPDLVVITITAFQQEQQVGQATRIVKKTADDH
jgi:Tfp pilus assembly protein PilV